MIESNDRKREIDKDRVIERSDRKREIMTG